MKPITTCLLATLILIAATSCRKDLAEQGQNPIETVARKTLETLMSPQDFNDLNWDKRDLITGKFGQADAIIRIPSKSVEHKAMYFRTQNDSHLFNWVEIQNETRKNGKLSAHVVLTDVSHNIIGTFSVAENRYVIAETTVKGNTGKHVKVNSDEPILSGSGGDAVVTGYIKTTNTTQTFWRLDLILRGSANEQLYVPEEGGGGGAWSVSFVFENPTPDEVEPDTTYITPTGLKHFTATSYVMVLGRAVTTDFNVNLSTFDVSDVSVRVTGFGVYAITFVGVKGAYTLGSPDKTLFIDLDMTYTIANFTPLGIPFDITIPVTWTISVPGINQGGNRVKLY